MAAPSPESFPQAIEDVFLLEELPKLGMATSTRNSGVIHSGIYYPPGTLKARLCVAGNRLTHEFCAAHGVPHNNCGKLVVATHDSKRRQSWNKLAANGRANGVAGLRVVGRERIRELEPHITAVAALEVPSTGILSSEELTKGYARVATERGANILTDARVTSLDPRGDGDYGGHRAGRSSRAVPAGARNDRGAVRGQFSGPVRRRGSRAAGQHALPHLSGARGIRRGGSQPGPYLVNALVYPLPHSDHLSLGMHLTRTLWGTVLVGPTARYVEGKNDYEHDRLPLGDFLRGAQLLLPELKLEDLKLAYSGLRPKLVPPDKHEIADFVITRDPSWPRAIHLVGIESPGLTSAPAIARYVAPLVAETLS